MEMLKKTIVYLTAGAVVTDEEQKAIDSLTNKRTKVVIMNSKFIDPERPPKADSFEGKIPKGFKGPIGNAGEIKKEADADVKAKSEVAGGTAKQASAKSPAKGNTSTAWKPN